MTRTLLKFKQIFRTNKSKDEFEIREHDSQTWQIFYDNELDASKVEFVQFLCST